MKKLLTAAALTLPLMLSGCVISVDGDGDYGHHSDWEDREIKNRKYVSNLDVNIPIARVKSKLGVPDFSESYQQDGKQVQVLFYRTQRMDGDGVTTKDECTPLVFSEGVLIGWGETAYAQI